MIGLLYLSWRHLMHHRAASALLVLALGTTAFVPLATRLVTEDFERSMFARAEATPLVCGARGNRFDLVLSALYFRSVQGEPMRFGDLDRLTESPLDVVVPLNLRHSARGEPIVATSPEYFERRGLRAASGSLPVWIGECVLGANVLVELEVGETVFSDVAGSYDIASAVPLELTVAGRLAANGTPDDDALFVSTETGWMLEGALHGHGEPAELDESTLLGAGSDQVMVGPALVEHRGVDAQNRGDFHLHAEREELALSAALVFPATAKSRTMMRTRVKAQGQLDVVDPSEVVEELVQFVFRIRAVLDVFAAVLGGATLIMGTLVILLSLRLRAGELATLERIGAGRSVALRLVSFEIAIVLLLALVLAAAGLGALRLGFPDLMQLLP